MSATVVLDQQVRNGTFQSASIAVPLNPDGTPATNPDTGAPYAFVEVLSTMSQTDAADATKTARGAIRASYDGVNYEGTGSGTWEWNGGGINSKTGLYRTPGLGISIPSKLAPDGVTILWAQRVMATLDCNGNFLNTGLTLDVR